MANLQVLGDGGCLSEVVFSRPETRRVFHNQPVRVATLAISSIACLISILSEDPIDHAPVMKQVRPVLRNDGRG